jgi:hypothetical protein
MKSTSRHRMSLLRYSGRGACIRIDQYLPEHDVIEFETIKGPIHLGTLHKDMEVARLEVCITTCDSNEIVP